MTREELDDALYDIAEGEATAVYWASADQGRAEEARARRDEAELAVLAEFDRLTADRDRLADELERMRPVFEAAMRYALARRDNVVADGSYEERMAALHDLGFAAQAAMEETSQ